MRLASGNEIAELCPVREHLLLDMASQDPLSVSRDAGLDRPADEAARDIPLVGSMPRLLSLGEMVAVYGIIEAAIWTEGVARWQWFAFTLAVVIIIGLYRRDLWPHLGLGHRGLAGSLWVIPGAAALSCAILAFAYLSGTLHSPFSMHLWYGAAVGYLLWALQQQYLLQSFFFTRFEALLGSWRAVIAATLLFSFAHIPNPILVPATFAMALVFCSLFRVYRNIYALSVAHAMLGLALAAAIPEAATRHMRVGIGYLHYLAR